MGGGGRRARTSWMDSVSVVAYLITENSDVFGHYFSQLCLFSRTKSIYNAETRWNRKELLQKLLWYVRNGNTALGWCIVAFDATHFPKNSRTAWLPLLFLRNVTFYLVNLTMTYFIYLLSSIPNFHNLNYFLLQTNLNRTRFSLLSRLELGPNGRS